MASHAFINHWDEAIEDLREIFKIQPNTPMVVACDPGAQLGMWWWEQVGIDLVGGREASVEMVEGDGGEELHTEVIEDSRGGAKL